jgi:hypothetical protein
VIKKTATGKTKFNYDSITIINNIKYTFVKVCVFCVKVLFVKALLVFFSGPFTGIRI